MATSYEIHPAIGIARLGMSDEFFVGPEPGTQPPTSYRDASKKLLRQAARFRIYECDRDAQGVLQTFSEVSLSDASITWTVDVANRKAVAARIGDGGATRRNHATGDDTADASLIIHPTPRQLSGGGAKVRFDDGQFQGVQVSLGEAQTDADGSLLFLAAKGDSGSPHKTPLVYWAENDGWYDNIADGPIKAQITLKTTGQTIQVKGAWVVAGPPDFAPAVMNIVSLYDALFDVADDRGFVTQGRLPALPDRDHLAWDIHIQPVLSRVMAYKWVNKEAQDGHGDSGPGDFNSPRWAGIDDPGAPNLKRQSLMRLLRQPGSVPTPNEGSATRAMPRLFDDAYLQEGQGKRDRLPLSKRQYAILNAWAQGKFVKTASPSDEKLPDAITRAALEACVGGAFVPGIEVTHTIRNHDFYMPDEPFRISHDVKLGPGMLTADMALPWQTDFTDCAWDEQERDSTDPTGTRTVQVQMGWWPAQRPDEVFPDAAATAMVDWLRFPPGSQDQTWRTMIDHWSELGIVVKQSVGGAFRVIEIEREYNAAEDATFMAIAQPESQVGGNPGVIRKFQDTAPNRGAASDQDSVKSS